MSPFYLPTTNLQPHIEEWLGRLIDAGKLDTALSDSQMSLGMPVPVNMRQSITLGLPQIAWYSSLPQYLSSLLLMHNIVISTFPGVCSEGGPDLHVDMFVPRVRNQHHIFGSELQQYQILLKVHDLRRTDMFNSRLPGSRIPS